MKQCPRCNRIYDDDSLRFCLEDGAALTESSDSAATLIIPPARMTEARTEVLPLPPPPSSQDHPAQQKTPWTHFAIIALLALIAGGGIVWLLRSGSNANSNPDNERAMTNNPTPRVDASAPPANTPAASGERTAQDRPAATPTDPPATKPATGTWFVILGSFTKDRRDAAEQKLQAVRATGYEASIIDTDNYPALSPGYWAVVVGPMSDGAAKSTRNQMRSNFPDAYAKSGF